MEPSSRPPSWWHTLPGALTALAALITALGGLAVAIHQTGWLSPAPPEAVSSVATPMPALEQTIPANAVGNPAGAAGAAGQPPRAGSNISAGTTHISLGTAEYTLLGMQLTDRNPESQTLRIEVRKTNNRSYPDSFWDASFRLLVDDVPRAPISNLNKVVMGESAEEGVVEFVVPRGTRSLTLRIRQDDQLANVPLHW